MMALARYQPNFELDPVVEVRLWRERHEELASAGVAARVGHPHRSPGEGLASHLAAQRETGATIIILSQCGRDLGHHVPCQMAERFQDWQVAVLLLDDLITDGSDLFIDQRIDLACPSG